MEKFKFTEKPGQGYILYAYNGNEKEIIISDFYNGKQIIQIGVSIITSCGKGYINVNENDIPLFIETSRCENPSLKNTRAEKPNEFSYAFAGCTELEKITLPETLICIGYGAFEGCTKLQEIVIPKSIEEIESEAFFNCTALRRVRIEREKSIRVSPFFKIAHHAFYQSNEGISVPIPNLIIEVPKALVDEYKADKDWKEYKIVGY